MKMVSTSKTSNNNGRTTAGTFAIGVLRGGLPPRTRPPDPVLSLGDVTLLFEVRTRPPPARPAITP